VPTNKELLEAEAFHRRRLVAALLSGSSYDEPARVLRPFVLGVLVALALAGGVLVAGYLGGRP
jgi:hypothetical protein